MGKNKGVYDFGHGGSDNEYFLDIAEFLKTAQEEDLLALVRPGPYMCAEYEFGGFPSWILRNTSSVRNSKDENFLSYVKRYFNMLLPILALLQFQKGGPIIAFQIENEYGNTGNDDLAYLQAIQQIFKDNNLIELYYTSDPVKANGRGAIPGVLQTANFGSDPKGNLDKLNMLQSNKPTMTMEYYPGWFDHWLEGHHTGDVKTYKQNIEEILDYPSSVNQYMFIGSTNFGFTNGANSGKNGTDNSGLQPITTSYDYDAPITEYGAYTEKYNIIKEAIAARAPVKFRNPDPPELTPVVRYSSLDIKGQITLSDLINQATDVIESENILPMEYLPINDNSGQSYGYIVYSTTFTVSGKVSITIGGYVRDTVLVLSNGKLVSPVPETQSDVDGFGFWRLKDSTLDIETNENTAETFYKIDLIVENFGRNTFGALNQFRQFKGLTDDVYLNGDKLTNWKIIPFEFKRSWTASLTNWQSVGLNKATPALYKFTLELDDEPTDTYLDMRGWNKGIVIVNSYVLGRHFFLGPQQALYLPGPLLTQGQNTIIVFEHYDAANQLTFSDKPIYELR